MNFWVNDYKWVGAFIGGKPFLTANQFGTFLLVGKMSPVTIKAHVNVDYDDMGPYDVLRLSLGYPLNRGVEPRDFDIAFDPTDGEITWSFRPGYPEMIPGPPGAVALLAGSGSNPRVLLWTTVTWEPEYASCPVCPTACCGGCAEGNLSYSAPDHCGNSSLSYSFDSGLDSHGIGTKLVFSTATNAWSFTALPGNVSVSCQGQTGETPARDCWWAIVPAADGTRRYYCNDSSSGEFVPWGPYGTTFKGTGSGWVETIGDHAVHYNSSGVIEKVVRGQAVHTYSRDPGGTWVDITANTCTPTKVRYSLQNGVVQSIQQYTWLSGSWREVRRLTVSRQGEQISQVTVAPGGRTTTFNYTMNGLLTSYQDCSGRTWTPLYEEA